MRVMFSAIVTAMIGLYFLDLVGVMPISNIGLIPSYILPQLVGGLLLGVGFIVGGYCPGTSIVASVSGKIDAIFFVCGIFIGGLMFTMAYGLFEPFHNSTFMRRILLHEYFGVSSAVMVVLVVVFAVLSLYAVTHIESVVNARFHRVEEKS